MLRCQIQRRPETMHQVDSGCTSSPRAHARNERHEANNDNGSCAKQGRGGQSNDEQGRDALKTAEAEVALPQAQRGAERSEQGDEHSKSSAVHQDKSGAGFPGTSSQRRTSPWPGAEPSQE